MDECLHFSVHLNVNFVNFLLEHIENPDQDGEFEQIVDGFVRLILAFNLHFELPEENFVMKALAARGTAKNFTEKLLLMFNREGRTVIVCVLFIIPCTVSALITYCGVFIYFGPLWSLFG